MVKEETMKVVNIQCLFPELKGGHAYQSGRGEGSNVKAATARAFADMFRRMKVRKAFTEFSAKVQVRDMGEAQSEVKEAGL
jgi:hypothetical protein